MITTASFRQMLEYLSFTAESDTLMSKAFPAFQCFMKVDFQNQQLIYPEAIIGRERNDNFLAPENFIVFECVFRLMTKGYRPEHIELEKVWALGHEAKSGRADICVYDEKRESMLFIIECKTAGREFDKAWKDTQTDGGQLFSYWQQERATKWLVLYASDFDGASISYKSPTINCSDDANIVKIAKRDKSINLYATAYTAQEKFTVWRDTYSCKAHDKLIFSDDTVAYQIGLKPLRKKT